LVVLNGQFQDVQWKQQNSEHTADVFEQAVSLAASLCIRGLQMGIPMGFASNLAIEGTRKPVTILPKDGIYQEDTLLAAFAQLDTGAFWQNTSLFLNELEEYSGLDIMVLSFYDSDALKQSVEKLRQSGNQVSFHLLEGGNL
jgi:hypothetical protein